MKEKIKIIRIFARIIGLLASIFWGGSLLLHVIFEKEKDLSLEGFLLTILVVLNIVGVITAWKNEKTGSIIIIISSIALAVFTYISAGRNEAFAVLVSAGPFLAAGILFLFSWLKLGKANN